MFNWNLKSTIKAIHTESARKIRQAKAVDEVYQKIKDTLPEGWEISVSTGNISISKEKDFTPEGRSLKFFLESVTLISEALGRKLNVDAESHTDKPSFYAYVNLRVPVLDKDKKKCAKSGTHDFGEFVWLSMSYGESNDCEYTTEVKTVTEERKVTKLTGKCAEAIEAFNNGID